MLQNANVLGWFDHDKLVSQLSIYPCSVNIHNRIFAMGGITGVGTYPEYANLGLMNDLIKVALQKMKDNKQYISYLYPYSIPYYRHKGWEILSDRLTFTIKDSQLPKHADVSGHVVRHGVAHEDVLKIYDRFARANHGAMIRGEAEWEEYWRWENEEERTAAVYYNALHEPAGYVMYWIAEDVFHIKEMIYFNQEARKGLWNFISAHFSMIDSIQGNIFKNEPLAFLLDDGHIVETIEPYYMARIVDVEAFLKGYPFLPARRPFQLHFVVTDRMAPWNDGVFGIKWANGKMSVTRSPVGEPVELSIQILSSLLMSYRSPSYFHGIERLKTDERTLRILEEVVPGKQAYFSDYF